MIKNHPQHSRIWEQAKANEKNAELKEKEGRCRSNQKKAVKNLRVKLKNYFGRPWCLADLKKKMTRVIPLRKKQP